MNSGYSKDCTLTSFSLDLTDFTAEELKQLQDLKRTPVKGWFSACDLDSPANIKPDAEMPSDETLRE